MTVTSLLLVLFLAAGSPPADAPTVTPAEAAPGDRVVLAGLDVGSKAPRVWLRAVGSETTRRLKVVAPPGADGTTVRVRPTEAGLYDILLRPRAKGADTVVLPAALDVKTPEDLAVSPGTAGPRDVLEVTGRFLGSRRGRVLVAGRRAPVLDWEPATDGGDGQVRVRVPRRLGDGSHPVEVVTRAGSTRLDDALAVVESGIGPEPVLRAQIGDTWFEAAASTVGYTRTSDGTGIILAGREGKVGKGLNLYMRLTVDPDVPGALSLRGKDAVVVYAVTLGPIPQVWTSSYGLGGHSRVLIQDSSGEGDPESGIVRGTIDGLLVRVYGLGEDLLELSNAEFVAGPRP